MRLSFIENLTGNTHGFMCGRYRRKSDKQRIADTFEVSAGLDEIDLAPEDDIAPGSVQPIVSINPDGERQIELMRWGFKLPDRLLFNARSEDIDTARFWKDSFAERRCIIPADAVFEWKKVKSGKKPKYEISIPGQQPFGMAALAALEEPEDESVGAHIRRNHWGAE
jgi:putative SOS response-associated peptidase YedK